MRSARGRISSCRYRAQLAGPPAPIPVVLRQTGGGVGVVALVPVAVVGGRSDQTRRWRQRALVVQIEEGPLVDGPGPGVVEQGAERGGRDLLVPVRIAGLDAIVPERYFAEETLEGVAVGMPRPPVVGRRAVELGIEQALAAALVV